MAALEESVLDLVESIPLKGRRIPKSPVRSQSDRSGSSYCVDDCCYCDCSDCAECYPPGEGCSYLPEK